MRAMRCERLPILAFGRNHLRKYQQAASRLPLPSGVTLARPVCDGRILDNQGVHDILWGSQQLYLIGTIEYADSGGIGIRQTAFCRRLRYNDYPPRTEDFGRFEIIEDSDYEYYD